MDSASRRIGIVFGTLCIMPSAGLGAPAVALPAMRADLHATLGASSWVLAAYSLAASVGMVLFSRILARTGPRLILVLSSLLLAAGAVLALLAPSLSIVVLARLVLGFAAAGVLISAYASVTALPASEKSKALATIAAFVGIGSACGPLIGGVLVTTLGWRSVIISPVVSVLLVPVALRLLSTERRQSQEPFDWLGAGLLTVLGSAAVALLESRATGMSGVTIVVLAILAIGSLAGLIVETRQASHPFLPLRVLRVPGFLAACFAGAACYAGYFALLFAAPVLLAARGYRSIEIGLFLLTAVIGSIAASRFGRTAGHHIGVPWTVTGLGLITLSAVLLVALTNGAPVAVAIGIMFGISGFAGAQVVFLAVISQAVQPEDIGAATGLFNFVAFIGGALGPACVGTFAVSMPVHSALAITAILPLVATMIALLVVVRRHQAGVSMMRI
jgi:DHA2 family metal-tetracycline-proton antiporter-like MFS transporter